MYELSRNRFKEMKHFCLQYPEKKERISELMNDISRKGTDPTGEVASELADLIYAVKLIEKTAYDVGKFPGEKILKIVTENRCIGEVCPLPECEWYVRKFYWLLSERKGV